VAGQFSNTQSEVFPHITSQALGVGHGALIKMQVPALGCWELRLVLWAVHTRAGGSVVISSAQHTSVLHAGPGAEAQRLMWSCALGAAMKGHFLPRALEQWLRVLPVPLLTLRPAF
jgi:hypothetical protein